VLLDEVGPWLGAAALAVAVPLVATTRWPGAANTRVNQQVCFDPDAHCLRIDTLH
jgi:hypothetical protein